MFDFDSSFINLDPPPAPGDPPSTSRNFTTRLRAAIDALMGSAARGGVIWLPPGDYRINVPFEIPPGITLSFAPGARIVPIAEDRDRLPVSRATFQILGEIDADLREIFATDATAPAGLPPYESSALRVGRVVFLSERNPRVHPEWWGAARDPSAPSSRVDHAAIVAAFGAAVIDRAAFTTMTPRPPLVVALTGSYRLDRPIALGGDEPQELVSAIVMEGAQGGHSTATLTLDDRPEGLPLHDALLTFTGVRRVTLQGISLNARGQASRCLRFNAPLSRDGATFSLDVRGCSFEAGRKQQIVVEDTSASSTPGSLRANIRECTFRQDDGGAAVLAPTEPGEGAAVSVLAGSRSAVVVDACVFDGYFLRSIYSSAARANFSACHFAGRNPAGQFPADAAAITVGPGRLSGAVPPEINVVACVSRSLSLLHIHASAEAAPSPATATPSIVVVLTACVQRTDPELQLGPYWPPAVLWRGVAADRTPEAARLTALGCLFELPTTTVGIPPLLTGFAVPHVPRVFLTAPLSRVNNVATIPENLAAIIGSFSSISLGTVRSLGADASVDGPLVISFPTLRDLVRANPVASRVLAWALE